MKDNLTESVFQTLQQAQSIFEKKSNDYGTTWRVYRITSIADQLYIKAKRIGVISNKTQKVNGIGDGIESEFLGIINYSIAGIIQNRLEDPKPGEEHMSTEEAMNNYSETISKFNDYLETQNPYYVEEIERLEVAQISELLAQKIQRLKNFHINGNKVLVFGALLEILLWSVIGHTTYKATR